jgi:CheY-like chemotaxis protein
MTPPGVVLVVEDDQNDRLLISHAFRKSAPNVRLHLSKDSFDAEDYLLGSGSYGDRAVHALPSLILLDLKLPRRSGLDFLAWIKRRPELAAIPVIILSSSHESSDLDRAYELGAKSYLVKSVELKELMKVAEGIAAYASLLEPPSPNAGSPSGTDLEDRAGASPPPSRTPTP